MKEVAEFFDRVPCGSRHSNPETQRYFVQPHIPGFAQFWKWNGKKVLEIGCGIGVDTLEFCKAGAIVDALDASRNSLELTIDRCYPYISRSLWIWNLDTEEELPERTYDLIYSFGVLHHTPHPERALKLAYQHLAYDGELRIMLYARWSIKHLLGIQPEAQAGCPLVKWYSGWEARNLLWDCGFKVKSIRKTHIFPWRISDYIEHRFVKCWYWRWMPDWLFHVLERIGGHHLLLIATKQ